MLNDPKVKEITERHKAIWKAAFEQLGQDLIKVDESDKDRRDALLKKQKDLEGQIPEFESVFDEPKKKPSHLKDYSDSLLRVGNFLGSAKDMMPEIGKQQLHVLNKIEGHLRHRGSSGNSASSTQYPP